MLKKCTEMFLIGQYEEHVLTPRKNNLGEKKSSLSVIKTTLLDS